MYSQNPTVGLTYFSPTGTTKRVCEEIASSMTPASIVRLDLTRPKASQHPRFDEVNIWVVGVPVYASQLPAVARERICQVIDDIPKKSPAIAVAVYGNVDAGAALDQLVDLLSQKGLNVIGAGEFVGEHWFKKFHGLDASGTFGRPNEADLAVARELGVSVLKKGPESSGLSSVQAIQAQKVPFMLRSSGEQRVLNLLGASAVDPKKCTGCQACVKTCPMGCIDPKTLTSDASSKSCLGCGNCLRVCPAKARTQNLKLKWLVKRMAKPKTPAAKSTYHI